MPVDLGPARPRAWSEPGRTTREIHTGGWRTARPEYVEALAPCRAACPGGEPIALWIERARAGDVAGAWSLIRQENPFPAIMGRVCAHPCERACNRGAYDGAVGINALEQFVGDWGLSHGTVTPPPVRRAEKIAVVGGGPAGLAGAYHLARLGYRVTIFEAEPKLGGVLRYGIPEYRLPRWVLGREIELVLALGIDTVTGSALGPDLDALRSGFDAVLLATGAGLPLRLDVPGDSLRGIEDGLAFLRQVTSGEAPSRVEKLVVIGGGSTAMDAARSARRLGVPAVVVVTLESRDAMPAAQDEITQALAEGVEIRNELGVVSFEGRDGAVCGVSVAPAHLERTDDGRVIAVFESGAESLVEAERVVLAIGQRPDPARIPGCARAGSGLITAGAQGETAADRLFAAGDAASLTRTVSHAIGGATRAARAIHARLSGETAAASWSPAAGAVARPDHTVAFEEINVHYLPRLAPNARRETPAAARLASFAEVLHGLDEATARAEAARCFTCGRCTRCDTCLGVCPDMAIARVDGSYRLSAEHCKGCGLCATECPRGALSMVTER